MITKMEAFSAQPSAPELQMAPGDMAANDAVQIRDIQGLGPVKAEVSSTPLATGRGEVYQGSSVGKRNIVLKLGLNPDWEEQTMASLRQLLYAYFLPQEWCKLRFYSHHLPVVDIEGICESFEPNIFSQDPEYEISILCHRPDFVDANATILEGLIDDGIIEIPFVYAGTVKAGFELTVKATPTRPTYTGNFEFVLKSPVLPQKLLVNPPVTVDATKYFKLNTVRGMRRIQNIAVADGATTNLMSKMSLDSVWPELAPGDNTLSISVLENLGQKWQLAYFNHYVGL